MLKAIPDLPDGSLDAIRRCLQTADNQPYDALATLLEKIQIQNSRLVEFGTDLTESTTYPATQVRLTHYMGDALEVHLQVQKVWPYARRSAETISTQLHAIDLLNVAERFEIRQSAYRYLGEKLHYIERRTLNAAPGIFHFDTNPKQHSDHFDE